MIERDVDFDLELRTQFEKETGNDYDSDCDMINTYSFKPEYINWLENEIRQWKKGHMDSLNND